MPTDLLVKVDRHYTTSNECSNYIANAIKTYASEHDEYAIRKLRELCVQLRKSSGYFGKGCLRLNNTRNIDATIQFYRKTSFQLCFLPNRNDETARSILSALEEAGPRYDDLFKEMQDYLNRERTPRANIKVRRVLQILEKAETPTLVDEQTASLDASKFRQDRLSNPSYIALNDNRNNLKRNVIINYALLDRPSPEGVIFPTHVIVTEYSNPAKQWRIATGCPFETWIKKELSSSNPSEQEKEFYITDIITPLPIGRPLKTPQGDLRDLTESTRENIAHALLLNLQKNSLASIVHGNIRPENIYIDSTTGLLWINGEIGCSKIEDGQDETFYHLDDFYQKGQDDTAYRHPQLSITTFAGLEQDLFSVGITLLILALKVKGKYTGFKYDQFHARLQNLHVTNKSKEQRESEINNILDLYFPSTISHDVSVMIGLQCVRDSLSLHKASSIKDQLDRCLAMLDITDSAGFEETDGRIESDSPGDENSMSDAQNFLSFELDWIYSRKPQKITNPK